MFRTFLLPLASLALLAGCASYQLGTTGELAYQSVFVAPPRNESTLPQLEAAINASVRESLEQSGALRIAHRPESDAVLEITVLEVRRGISAVSAEDVGRGRKFEFVADVLLNLRSAAQPDRFFIRNRHFTVTQDIFADNGQIDAEYHATPEVARKIAQRAAEIVSDAW